MSEPRRRLLLVSVALSKVDFATNIHEEVAPLNDVSFEGFLPLFTKIQEIKNLFRKRVLTKPQFFVKEPIYRPHSMVLLADFCRS